MIKSLFLQKVPIEKGRYILLVTRLALSSHFMYYLIVCTMKPMLLCALLLLSVNAKSFLWYRLSCHNVFVEIFCSFTDAYEIIDGFGFGEVFFCLFCT